MHRTLFSATKTAVGKENEGRKEIEQDKRRDS
jgi:hypothetical protein